MEPNDCKETMTVGQLLDYIEKHNIPREGKVLFQRIEDTYFNDHGWKTVKRPDFMHQIYVEKIADMKARPEEYPGENTLELADELQAGIDAGAFTSEYIPVYGPVGYDEHKHLFLDAHY